MRRCIFIILIYILSFSQVFSLTTESELFSLAEGRYHAKSYPIALETYDEFLTKFPLSDMVPDVQYRRAVCYFRLGRYQDALTLFKRIENRYRATRYLANIPFWAGMIFYHMKDYLRAVNSFNAFLGKTGMGDSVATALFYKGLCEVLLEAYEDAGVTLRKLIDEYAQSSLYGPGIVLYAFVLLKKGEYDELLLFTDSIQPGLLSQKESEDILFYKAEALWSKDEITSSESIYRELLAGSPDIASVAFRRLFIAAKNRDNITGMENLLQKAEELFSGSPEYLTDFWLNIGIESFQRKNYELAEHFFNKIWNLRDKVGVKATVPFYLSEVCIKRGDIKTARTVLETYISKEKSPPGFILMRLGDMYLLENNFIKSASYYGRFIGENPQAAGVTEAAYYLAYSRYREGNLEDALSITQDKLSGMTGGAYHKEFLKLQVVLLKKMGKVKEAFNTLKHYLALYHDDIRARIDYIKLQFIRKEYDGVISGVYELHQDFPSLRENDVYTFLLSHYFQGLSFIVKKMYDNAAFSLAEVSVERAEKAKLLYIIPYAQFYRAWALYRIKSFDKAALIFSSFMKQYPEHELVVNALYLAGWCYYSDNNFELAHSYFESLAQKKSFPAAKVDNSVKIKALFFQAKCLINLDKAGEAASIFTSLFSKHADSSFADDALFEYANILSDQGKSDDAAKAYLRLADRYPESPLREDALYRSAEVYFTAKQYEKARYAFYEYRLKYPSGKLYDASLYWGGLASFYMGEKYGAVLLWEKIIQKYRESPFRPNAMKKTAEIYMESGEFSKALTLYTELIASYPIEASAVNAEEQAEQLRYLILGLSNTEAELTVAIERNNGAGTKKGREALIELARLYLFEHGEEKREVAYQMLLNVVEREEDPDTASRAQYLVGEYFYLKGDYIRAGNEYLKAALINAANRDLMAVSIYKAAEMMKLAGKIQEVRELVARLTSNFPSSQWAEEGKRLLEGLK